MTTASVTRPEFLPNLQVVRFVAALCVVIEHLQFKTRDLGFMLSGWLVDFKPIYFPVGVDIFFVVSGFIMFHLSCRRFAEPGYWRTFLLRRLIRIVPLYWLFTALTLLAMLAFSAHMNHNITDPAHIAASLAFVPWPRFDGRLMPVFGGGWTLNYEMLFYAVFALALSFSQRSGTVLVAAVIIGLVALHPLVPASWWALEYWTAPIILDFLLGVGLAMLYDRGLRLSRGASALVLAAGIAWLVVSNHYGAPQYIGRVLALGLPAALVCAALVFARAPARPGFLYRAALAGGDASYALYLSHAFTLSLLAIAARRLGLDNPYLFFGVGVAVSVVAAWLIYALIETRMISSLNRLVTSRGGHRRALADNRGHAAREVVAVPGPAQARDLA